MRGDWRIYEGERERNTREGKREGTFKEKEAQHLAQGSTRERGGGSPRLAISFFFCAVRLTLKGFTHSRELLTHFKQINWEPNLKGPKVI